MGKGNRSKTEREQKNAEKQQKIAAQQAEKRKSRLLTIGSFVLVVLILVGAYAWYNIDLNFKADGTYMRNTVAVSSNNYKVDEAMMSYFVYKQYYTLANMYGEYFEYSGIDTEKSMKEQEQSEGKTWFQYFADSAKTEVENLLYMNEAARAAGLALSNDEKTAIKKRADEYTPTAYGAGLKNEDIARCLMLSALADKYKDTLLADGNVTDAEIEEYYQKNIKNYTLADYISYDVSYADGSGMTEAEAKAKAESFTGATDADSFNALLKSEVAASTGISEEDAAGILEKYVSTEKSYTAGDDISEWLFSDDTKLNSVGAINNIIDEKYTALILTGKHEKERDESKTATIRHIMLTEATNGTLAKAKTAADNLLAEWQAGDKSDAAFSLMALQYSEDSSTLFRGGIFRNMSKDQIAESFNTWALDEERAAGDSAVLESDYGYHVALYIGDGEVKWKADIINSVIDEKFTKQLEEFKTSYKINVSDDAINNIAM